MAKPKRPQNRKPLNDKERIDMLEFYVAILVKNAKIENTDMDIKWG